MSEDATYELRPTRILDRKEQVLRNKVIPLVKVLWTHHSEEEATWEINAEVRKNYPQILKEYEKVQISRTKFLFKGDRL
ncbi:hypothetical protein PJO47_29200 [Mycobacterium kansasii]